MEKYTNMTFFLCNESNEILEVRTRKEEDFIFISTDFDIITSKKFSSISGFKKSSVIKQDTKDVIEYDSLYLTKLKRIPDCLNVEILHISNDFFYRIISNLIKEKERNKKEYICKIPQAINYNEYKCKTKKKSK